MDRRTICTLFILVVVFSSSVLAQNRVRLDKISVPHHYAVDLTINVAARRFFVEETIFLRIHNDTTTLQLNSFNLDGAWLQTRLVTENGVTVYTPNAAYTKYDSYSEVLHLQFPQVIPGNANYTLHLTDIRGSFGSGLFEVPLPFDSTTNSSRYLLTTGFDATNLRTLFPCYDQPEFKTTFNFTVHYPSGQTLITNGADVGVPVVEANNFLRSTFEISFPLSTHSIGLAITNMEGTTRDTRVQTYHLDIETRIRLESIYFLLLREIEAPENPQVNILYVPSLEKPAITKWGLVAVGEEMGNNTNPAHHHLTVRQTIASIYEQYFGNMISAEWWDSQWITKGLSRYFGGVFDTREIFGGRPELEFVVDTVQRVLKGDGSSQSPLNEGYLSVHQINNPNLLIVDRKAGAIMRMISDIMGTERFNESVVGFAQEYKFSAVTSEQFFSHLELYTNSSELPQGKTLSSILKVWESTPGHPVVKVVVQDGSFNLSVDNPHFDIPVNYVTPTRTADSKLWLFNSLSIANSNNDPWILVNPGQFGLYRVNYEDSLWQVFTDQLNRNHSVFSSFNRAQLIDDSANLAIDGLTNFGNHFALQQPYLNYEGDHLVWRVVRRNFEVLSLRLRGLEERRRFDRYYSEATNEQYIFHRIGVWEGDFDVSLDVGIIACMVGNPECVNDVDKYLIDNAERVDRVISRIPQFQYLFFCTASRYSANHEQLDVLLRHLIVWSLVERNTNSLLIATNGFGCTTNPTVINQFLEFALTDAIRGIVVPLTSSQRTNIFRSFLHGSYESTKNTLEYILANYVTIGTVISPMDGLFEGLGEFIVTNELLHLLNQIRTVHAQRITDSVRLLLNTAAEEGNQNTMWFSAREEEVNAWLRGHGNSMKAVNGVLLLISVVIIKYLFV